MIGLNYVRTYAQTGEHAACRTYGRPPRTAKVKIVNGQFHLDGVGRFPLFFTAFVDGAAIPKVDAELIATLKRVVSDGYNGIRLRSISNRTWTSSVTNWGWWTNNDNDGSYTNRWVIEEAALVQLDKMVAYALDYGIECIYIDLEGYDQICRRHPNQRAQGTYQGRGMQWSDEWRQMQWDVNSRLLTRTNTIDGIRYCDNGRIIWNFNNECGFGDAFSRSTTNAWGGGSSVHWFQKIIENITDTSGSELTAGSGNNGYWYTELCSKLTTWAATYAPSWSIPAWGRGSTGVADGVVGWPSRSTWFNWATGADPATDRNNLIDCINWIEVDYVTWLIGKFRALRSDIVVCPGTFIYSSPLSFLQLPAASQTNLFMETHHYFPDNVSIGVKTGSSVTRRSIMDTTWTVSTDGGGWVNSVNGARSSSTAFLAGECGQYGPNRWRYQRMYYEMLSALLNGYDASDFDQCQQYSITQFTTDGRYATADHVNVASPAVRLTARAIAPALRFSFMSEYTSSFTIQATKDSIQTYQHTNKAIGFQGNRLNSTFSGDGSENANWGGKKVYFDIVEGSTPTTVWTSYPKILDATIAAGTMVVNTASEKFYLKRAAGGYGAQFMTPYMCGYIDTLVAKAAADAIFTGMPMWLSSMASSPVCAVCFLRSDGLYNLFTGAMKLYIHGSDYSNDLVFQGNNGGTYQQGAAGAFGVNNPPGDTFFMANDQVTVYYASAASQTWGSGNPTAAATYLMMPEAFTVNFDTSAVGTDLEIYGVTAAGIPVRIPSTYSGGIVSFNYDGTYPEYTINPVALRSVKRSKQGSARR